MFKNKKQIVNKIYKEVKHDGIFHDCGWAGVHKVIEGIRNLGLNVDYYPTNSQFYNQGYSADGSMKAKSYDLEINYNDISFKGQLVCSGCGSIEFPLDMYDIVLMF